LEGNAPSLPHFLSVPLRLCGSSPSTLNHQPSLKLRKTIHQKLNEILKGQKLMADKLENLDNRLKGIETSQDEAFTELSAEIAKLRQDLQNVPLPEAAEATLTRVETKAKALADIIANNPPPAQ
jgi:hypothetical protein